MGMPIKVHIAVFIGEPLDYVEYRHTALVVEFSNGSTSVMHVTGTHGLFQFDMITDCNPRQAPGLARMILVTELQDSVSPACITKVISATPIKNERQDADWNCQSWIGDALAQLVKYGYLCMPRREAAINQMVDVCLEAKDEPNRPLW